MTEDSQLVTVRVRNRRAESYHTNPETCQSISDDSNTEEIPVADAKRRGLELCRWCDPTTTLILVVTTARFWTPLLTPIPNR